MSANQYVTIGQLTRTPPFCGVPAWKLRRAVDALGVGVMRAGLYRLVARDLLPRLEAELRRAGYLPQQEVSP
jgi:hypothetical protein